MRKRAHISGASDRPRGFTLIELMVVVVLVGIMVMLAVPSMSGARYDRRVHESATNIAQLVRDARARAMGRGAAVVVQMSNATQNRGSYRVYEAVMANNGLTTADGDGGVVANRTPDNRCKRGALTLTDTTQNVLVDSVELSGVPETEADILSLILRPDGTAAPTGDIVNLCFTPTGRMYYLEGTPVNFDPVLPMTESFSIIVRRRNSLGGGSSPDLGLRRRVIVTPNGITRIVSGTKLAADPS